MFGYAEAEAVGQPITLIIPPELRDEENEILKRLGAGGRIEHYETIRVTKTREKIAVSLTISPIKDSSGRLVGFSKIAHDITERKRAEELQRETNRALEEQAATLRSQEELLKIFVKTVPAGVAMLDREMRYLQVSDRWCADYGVDASQVLGRSHYEVFPDIPQRWKEVHRRALEGETLRAEDDRWDRQGGVATWVRWEIRPWRSSSGNIGGILIFAEDTTHRKQMEEALSGMSRKLIESQEQERARIGRELHDDINQRLAMVGVELEQLQDNPSEVANRVQELRKAVADISNDVQALSHELHSSKLEYLGVVAGIKSWCKEFSERQRMEIDFKNEVSSPLPFEVGLSLFRVIQEALHNAIKHSGVRRVAVQLGEHSNEVHLIVSDSGRGFDTEAAKEGRGLGLTSMRERVRLVNGSISIESKPMGGTTIHVRVPLGSEKLSERAVG
jgi:PAS domain S-box-containing protein